MAMWWELVRAKADHLRPTNSVVPISIHEVEHQLIHCSSILKIGGSSATSAASMTQDTVVVTLLSWDVHSL